MIVGSAVRLQPRSQDFVDARRRRAPAGTDTAKRAEVQFVDKLHPATARLPRRWSVAGAVGLAQEEPDRPRARARLGRREDLHAGREARDGRRAPRHAGAATSATAAPSPRRSASTKAIWNSPVFRRQLRARSPTPPAAQRRLRRDRVVELEAHRHRRRHHRRHAARRRPRRARLLHRAPRLDAEDLRPGRGHRQGGGLHPVRPRPRPGPARPRGRPELHRRTAGSTCTTTSRA